MLLLRLLHLLLQLLDGDVEVDPLEVLDLGLDSSRVGQRLGLVFRAAAYTSDRFLKTIRDLQAQGGTTHSRMGSSTSIMNQTMPHRFAYRGVLWRHFLN